MFIVDGKYLVGMLFLVVMWGVYGVVNLLVIEGIFFFLINGYSFLVIYDDSDLLIVGSVIIDGNIILFIGD